MTLAEYKAWFEGYLLGGGKDVDVVKAKLAEVVEISFHPLPYQWPQWIPTVYPSVPIIPTAAPYEPWTLPQPWITWSGTGTCTGIDPEIQTVMYNA